MASTAVAAATGLAYHVGHRNSSHTATPRPTGSTPTASPSFTRARTPATGRVTPLLKPRTVTDGIGTGFEHSSLGAESAAVTYWQDLDILDPAIARRQWSAITSPDSPQTITAAVDDISKVREGSGLPPTGGTPAGLSFTTVVKATLVRSLDDEGQVIEVWMAYDRYATIPGKAADDNPLTDQTADLILKWQHGDWKVTEEPQWTVKRTGPRTYDPNSPWAYADGWREVEVSDA